MRDTFLAWRVPIRKVLVFLYHHRSPFAPTYALIYNQRLRKNISELPIPLKIQLILPKKQRGPLKR